MTIDKPYYYEDSFYGRPRIKKVSSKVSKVISERLDRNFMSSGGLTRDPRPTNVIPLIPNPNSPFGSNNPEGWSKADFVTDAKADIEFYREQLFKIYGGGVMKLKKSELKELLQFHIDTGGI